MEKLAQAAIATANAPVVGALNKKRASFDEGLDDDDNQTKRVKVKIS